MRFCPTLAVALWLSFAGQVGATQEYTLPTLFDVTGVAADDRLNIRAAPNAAAQIIGTLGPRARDIEVVATDATGRWARVNSGEVSGWANMTFLAYQSDVWVPDALPPTLHCVGTEPFWSLRPSAAGLVLATPEGETAMRNRSILTTGIFRDPRRAVLAKGGGVGLTAVIVPMGCSDGMSDRSYGLDATLILTGPDGRQMLTGCCSIAP